MSGFVDRARAARLMEAAGLDAVLLVAPESVRWAGGGADPGVAALFRRAGAAMALIPADPAVPVAAVVGDLQAEDFARSSGIGDVRAHRIWVDTADARGVAADASAREALVGAALVPPRPATFDAAAALSLLRDAVAARGLSRARLGVEEAFLPVADAQLLRDALPDVAAWTDASPLVARLRAVKHPTEAAWLALAARAAEAGLEALLPELHVGVGAGEMGRLWREAALAEAARLGAPGEVGAWAYISVGEDGFGPGGPCREGDVLKFDVGCVVRGYSSDSARTVVLGEPSRAAREVHAALLAAFAAGEAMLRPGVPARAVHEAARAAMAEAGFPGWSRGHVGHGLGASVFSEEWPFLAADEEAALEPGMVLAFETPWYVHGLGAFMVEDQFAIGAGGAEPAWHLPRGLAALPVLP